MTTIEVDGKTYEVLNAVSTESRDCTHARIQSGSVVPCCFTPDRNGASGFGVCDSWVYFRSMETLGITPLRLVPKVPVEFVGEAEFISGVGGEFDIIRIQVPRGKFSSEIDGKTFRGVEVTE